MGMGQSLYSTLRVRFIQLGHAAELDTGADALGPAGE